jgi:dTDP-4-amino-4,6-dideoxygalactose transaminase
MATVGHTATAMSVPLLDLKAQYPAYQAELWPLLQELCAGQGFILGPQVTALEAALANYSQAAFGVGVSSGTDALLLAMMALDIGVGDAVLTSTYTFFATGGTIARLGAHPIFLDIDHATFNLSAVAVERFLDEQCRVVDGACVHTRSGTRVKAIMPVHLYGQAAEMAALLALAKRYHLKVIEDAAQALGTEYRGQRVGGLGDVGCFSFFPTKNLGAFGDAGLCTANDAELAERLRVLRVHGGKPKYFHSLIGGNFRIDELQAVVLNVKFKHLDAWTAGRQKNAECYRSLFAAAGLTERVELPYAVPGDRHIYNQFVIRVAERDALRAFLTEQRVGSEIYYPVPLHLQACFAYVGGRRGDCPIAEQAADTSLALPIYAELSESQLGYVVETIGRFYQTR